MHAASARVLRVESPSFDANGHEQTELGSRTAREYTQCPLLRFLAPSKVRSLQAEIENCSQMHSRVLCTIITNGINVNVQIERG